MSSIEPPLYEFSFSDPDSFEIGAWLIAILAFPGANEVEARDAAAAALGSQLVRITREVDPAIADDLLEQYPLLAMDLREEKRRLRTLPGRLRRRMLAARMSLAFFEENITGKPANLPQEMARLSLNELSKLVQEQSLENEPENIEHRVWRQSRPVIHLAAAVQIALRIIAGDRDVDLIGYPIQNGTLNRIVIDLARAYEDIVLEDRRFGVKPRTLIRLRRIP